MDILGKEALEQMLSSYPGTVLFVSHDRYFIRQTATGILEFGENAVTQYNCPYEEYLDAKKRQTADSLQPGTHTAAKQKTNAHTTSDIPALTQTTSGTPTLSDVFDRKNYYNPGKVKSRLLKQLEKYEEQLRLSEQHAAELKLQLMDPSLGTDYEKLMELQSQLDAEEHNQETLLERMMEAETELEDLGGQPS